MIGWPLERVIFLKEKEAYIKVNNEKLNETAHKS